MGEGKVASEISESFYSSPVTKNFISIALLALGCSALSCKRHVTSNAQISSQAAASAEPSLAGSDDLKETYAVYDALLGGPSSDGTEKSHRTIAIANRTDTGIERLCFDPSRELSFHLRAAGKDFVEQNSKEKFLVTKEFDLDRKVELISSADLDAIFLQGGSSGWERFRKNYPNVQGYITLSAVGFNSDKTFALVYSAAHCGPLCGAGGFSTLLKKNGVWHKNQERLCSWIS